MAKTLKIDKSLEMVTIELDKNELKDILDSIDLMIQDQKRNQCASPDNERRCLAAARTSG